MKTNICELKWLWAYGVREAYNISFEYNNFIFVFILKVVLFEGTKPRYILQIIKLTIKHVKHWTVDLYVYVSKDNLKRLTFLKNKTVK